MRLIGLTGGIGSGKTIVAELLQIMGIPVYDSDARTKALYDSDDTLKTDLIDMFGPSLYEGGCLNRKLFSDSIFQNPETLKAANKLVHPVVARDLLKWAYEHQDAPLLVQESAIVFETGLDSLYDSVLCVTAPESLRINRASQRNKLTPEEVKHRMRHQLPEAERLRRSDYVIVNDGEQALIPQVLHILMSINEKST